MRIIIFLSIFFLVFGSTGFYLFNRITQSFSHPFFTSRVFIFLYIFLIISFILGKIMEGYQISFISDLLIKIGAYSLAFFFYAVLAALFLDLLRLFNYIIPYYPNFIVADYKQTKFIVAIISASVILFISLYGFWNASHPRIKKMELKIDKKVDGLKSLHLVALSDIHLGTLVNETKIKRLIKMIEGLNPDLVLIAGDIVDDNIKVVKHYKLLEHFKALEPKYGIYGIMGNHEYIGKRYTDIPYYEDNNIKMLIDSSIIIDGKFYLLGRDDIQAKSMINRTRKTLPELTKNIDFNLPVILLDHQPYRLEETAKTGIDFQFSGHTHNGQLWPLNFITNLIFEQDWGYLKKGNTHFYISSGYGTAGPPIRVGNHPEIVDVVLHFAP